MTKSQELREHCPDCGAGIGDLHLDYCDVERCPDCGGQMLSCCCEGDIEMPRLPWTGLWPGVAECREFGWYSKLITGQGWTTCSKDDPEASENLNRLYVDAVWDKNKGRFVLKEAPE